MPDIDVPRGTVTFRRALRVREYETAEASVSLDIPTRPGDDLEKVIAAANDAFFGAKAVVFEQLGIPFDATVDGKAMEVLEQKLAAVEVTGAAAEAVQVARSNNVRSAPPAAVPTTKDELWAELASNPKQWFDNRVGKKNPKSPDFKRKGNPAPGEKYAPGLYVDKAPAGFVLPDPSAF